MTDVGYYAIPDPNDPNVITYWRRDGDAIAPWPKTAKYWPLLYRRDVPPALKGKARREWIHAWWQEHHQPWMDAIRRSIHADTGDAMQLFARLTTRCWCCGRRLTDPESQAFGIGPECRGRLSPERSADLMDGGEHA